MENPSLEAIKSAFTSESRPEQFLDFTHCEECAEHNETLRKHTRESIGLDELGNPGWDPICCITLEGFMYYFPALAELAMGQGEAYYLDQFIVHLKPKRLERFNSEQRMAVLNFLKYLQKEFSEELSIEYLTELDLKAAIEMLESRE